MGKPRDESSPATSVNDQIVLITDAIRRRRLGDPSRNTRLEQVDSPTE